MSHHSIVDPNLIYPIDNLPKREIISVKGGFLEGTGEGENRQIERLISTDPKMYLKSEFSPYSKYSNIVNETKLKES